MPNLTTIAQLIVNSLVAASEITLVGIGFALIYRTARFIHFAQALVVAFGAYFALAFHSQYDLPLGLSMCLAVVLCGGIGALTDLWVYRPLRNKGASETILLLASLGVYTIGQNAISLWFGDDLLTFSAPRVEPGFLLLGAMLSPVRAWIIGASLGTVVLVAILLRSTRIGKQLRCVGNNPMLAEVCGISSNRVILMAFIASSSLAGIAGVLLAIDTGMRPMMGINPLMVGIVAVIMAGAESVWAIAGAGLLVASVQQMAVWFFGAQWHEATTFLILLGVLVFKPTGLFRPGGRRLLSEKAD